jgi:mannose-1-phosphate guanylyltransferase
MKAMILAAGQGTRVRPVTEYVPKPMIPIIDRPVMEFLVRLLARHGFDEIVVSTSYLAHLIEQYFGDGSRFGVQMAYSFEGHHRNGEVVFEQLGSAGGLRRVQDENGFYDDTFAVLCGDAIVDCDLGAALRFHRERGSKATLLLKEVPRELTSRYGIVQLAPDGRILRFQEKPRPEDAVSTTANTGIYLLDPEVLDFIPRGTRFDLGGDLFPLLAEEGVPFYGHVQDFRWLDIGTTPDYWTATMAVLRGEVEVGGLPGRALAPGIQGGIDLDVDLSSVTGPVHIGSGTRIEPGAVIRGPVSIGRNCIVESGARVESSIVGNHTRVSGLADLRRRIVSGRFCVDHQGRNVELARTGYAFVVDDVRERRLWNEDQQALIDFLRSEVPRVLAQPS